MGPNGAEANPLCWPDSTLLRSRLPGLVKIDGARRTAIRSVSLREQMSFVLQDTVLFHVPPSGKISPMAGPKRRARKLSGLRNWLTLTNSSAKCSRGYDTMKVGERGISRFRADSGSASPSRELLSGSSQILILDEPTSGLDAGIREVGFRGAGPSNGRQNLCRNCPSSGDDSAGRCHFRGQGLSTARRTRNAFGVAGSRWRHIRISMECRLKGPGSHLWRDNTRLAPAANGYSAFRIDDSFPDYVGISLCLFRKCVFRRRENSRESDRR